MRRCRKCGVEYPLDQFKKHSRGNGRIWTCRLCINAQSKAWNEKNPEKVLASRVKMKYGLTLEEYRSLLKFGCEVCGALEGLHIDHDHTCCPGQNTCGRCVRGALCNRHNVALGMVNDSVEELESLVKYLLASRYRPW